MHFWHYSCTSAARPDCILNRSQLRTTTRREYNNKPQAAFPNTILWKNVTFHIIGEISSVSNCSEISFGLGYRLTLIYYRSLPSLNDTDGLVQDCSNFIANALGLLQSCTQPSILQTFCAPMDASSELTTINLVCKPKTNIDKPACVTCPCDH